jgi:4-amino-4-deoxy-L-arabinose transferase-like glycosyltransferase
MKWFNKLAAIFPYLVISAFIFFLVARTINRPVYIWDEAIYANNSLEMAKNNSYFVYTNNDTIDHYNTKPPLVLWLQAASFKIFGYNEAALRLPTFAALVGMIVLMIYYSRKLFGNTLYGIVASCFLLTSQEVVRHHVFLSGELDGVLVFFSTWILLRHLDMIRRREALPRDYLVSFVLFTLGYLAKSTAILLLIPPMFVSFLANRQLRTVVLNRYFAWCLLGFLTIVTTYYLVREKVDPGYFDVVWFSEFSRMYQSVMPWQEHPFDFYFQKLKERFLQPLIILILASIAVYLFNRERKHLKLLLHSVLLSLVYLLVISYPAVKLDYYAAPAYPPLCLAMSILTMEMFRFIGRKIKVNDIAIAAIALIPLFAFRAVAVTKTVDDKMKMIEPQEREAFLLKHLDKKYPHITGFKVLMDVEGNKMNHYDALNFYRKSMWLIEKKKVELYRYVSQVHATDSIIVWQAEKIDSLKEVFEVSAIDSLNDAYFIVIQPK